MPLSTPECLKENRMQPFNQFDKVNLCYRSTLSGTLEDNGVSQHPHPLEALQQLSGLDFPLDKLWERLVDSLPVKQKMEEMEARQKTLENIVSVLSRELGRRVEAPADTLGEAMARILYLEEKVDHQDSLLAMKDVMINNLAARIHTLEQTAYDGCFLWKISDVGLRTQEALTNNRPALYSPFCASVHGQLASSRLTASLVVRKLKREMADLYGEQDLFPRGELDGMEFRNFFMETGRSYCYKEFRFYTSRYGYKLRLKLFLNGDGTGTGTHLSLFLVVVKGEYDFQLKWPFQHKVTFTLLDQVNKHHFSTSFRPLQSSSSFQRPVSENNVASGLPEFFPLNLLHTSGTTYISNNTLAIQAVIDTKV